MIDDKKLRLAIRGLNDEQKEIIMEFVNSLHYETIELERARERFEEEAKRIIARLHAEEREVKAKRKLLGLMAGNDEEE